MLLPVAAFAQGGVYIYKSTPAPRCSDGLSCAGLTDSSGRVFITADTPVPVSAAPLAAMTPSTLVSVQATAVPTAYSTPQVPAVTGLRYLEIDNQTSNATLLCGFGTNTDHVAIQPGQAKFYNFAENGRFLSTFVNCHNADDGSNTGTVYFTGYK